jgi:protein involved in polysaccharide export with SLBB domain
VDNGNGHGTLSGNPGATTGGLYNVVFTASNGISPNATLNYALTVKQPIAFTSSASTTFTTGTAGSFAVTTTGYPEPTFGETGALPSGVTFTDNGNGTASLAGTPAAGSGGSYSITINATNGSSNPSQSFTLIVDQAPAITSAGNTAFVAGTAGTFSVTASGYPAPTYSVTAGTLPTGVTLTSTGLLSGTPAAGTGSTYPITITAANGTTNATQSFTLTVDQAPAISSASGTTFTVGASGSFSVTASGYPAPTYSVTGGTLPSGVTLTSAGLLSGTPAAGTGGTYPITITAANGTTNATQSFTLTVFGGPATHFVVTPSISWAAEGYPFSVTVTAEDSGNSVSNGYTGTVTFRSSDGSATLPANSTLTNGVGTFNVTLLSPGTQSIVATDTVNSSITGNASVLDSQGGPTTLTITTVQGSSTAGGVVTAWAGTGVSVTVAALNPNNLGLPANYNGGITITGSDPAFVPGSCAFINGTCNILVEFKTVGAQTITASETGLPAIASVPVTVIAIPGPAQYFGVSAPSSTNAGSPISFTVTAYDGGGNPTSYSGTAAFTSSDPHAILPASTTLSSGTGTFSATLETAGNQTITATDTVTPSITGTSGTIAVTTQYLVVNQTGDDAGDASNCSVQPAAGTTTNSDACSLRDALLEAASLGAANISFDSTVFTAATTIPVTAALNIPPSTTIQGPTSGSGAALTNLVTVSGGGPSSDFPVFTVNSSATNTTISGLTISNGNSTGNAGGIVNGYASGLTVINSTISGNTASVGTGAIFNDYNATLTVSGSTISGNSGSYGGIVNESGGTVTINSSTIANNTGAGISSIGTSVTVTASTISGNTGGYSGGGINNSSGALTLANSIVAGNTATTSPDVIGTYTDSGGNFIPGVNGVTLAGINLAPLRSYGGPMQTMVPVPGNFAICGGTLTNATAANLTADQRGLPFDPACPSGSVDSGAVQSNYALSFTTEPPSNGVIGAALSPAPVVTLTESGSVFAPATSTVTITDANDGLSPTGTNLAALSSGSATFSNLKFTSVETSDTLTASLSLSPNLSPALNLVAPPSTGINVVSGTPGITSVTPILPQQTQTITISGSGFGTQAPYTGDSQYIELVDTTAGGWAAGHSGAAITLAVSSWTNTQIVLSGFSGSYGTNGWCISPGDQLKVEVWNAQSGDGPAVYPIAASSGTNTCTLSIASVSPIASMQTQTITINGWDFGTQSPYTGSSNYIELVDTTAGGWAAGHSGSSVTLAVSSWTNTQIVLSGFSGSYGTNGWCISPGDQLSVKVWNAQSGDGPAVYPITASSGTNTCTLSIASVSPIVSEQTQTITINGADFGTQSPYTGSSNYIELVDTTAGGWAAGHSGSSVTLAVSSWTNTQIVLAGFSGSYGTNGWCISPGDQLKVMVWNAQTGDGPAVYPITASSGTNTCTLSIASVSPILPQQTQTITINGWDFGTQAPYTGDSNYIELIDTTAGGWGAGHSGAGVTLGVSLWTNTQIVLSGFSGSYGTNGWCISPGDQLKVMVWNAQTGDGPAVYPITASSGTNTCTLSIASVSPILPQQTQTITINGWDFGTQAPYTGDSNYIELIDTTAGGWAAGHSGAGVTLGVSSWTNAQIVLSGLSGAYGTHGWCIKPGDQLSVQVWNAQTGHGPAVYPITASSGTNTCP